MKNGFAALTLTVALLAAGAAFAEGGARAEDNVRAEDMHSSGGMSGNTHFLIGQTYLHDFWKPLDEPASFGVEVDFAPSKSPVHVALGFNMAWDSKHLSTPYYGQTGHVGAGFLEFSAGFLYTPVKHGVARPYLGAGVLRMFAGVGSGSDFWSRSDTDQSFGFYGNAGIFFKVGDTFNIGLDGRLVRGTKIALGGVDGNADYGQASLLLGFSWGE